MADQDDAAAIGEQLLDESQKRDLTDRKSVV